MEHVRIGRQPILDQHSNIVAYALMYREEIQNSYTSASLISNVLNKFGKSALLGDKRAFVVVDEKFLLHDLILSVPNEFFVFSISGELSLTPRLQERIELLHSRGYKLSLEHANSLEDFEPVLPFLNFAIIDIRHELDTATKSLIAGLKAAGITVVGDNIYDTVHYNKAVALGCDWFEGYFFAELKIVENAKYEPSTLEVLKLYRLLMDDVNIDEITKEFEKNSEITLQLLQFINSGAFHFKRRIASVHHILTLVGRIPLAQWLMLMIYSKSVSSRKSSSALMQMVKNRTELMQKILQLVEPDARSNRLGEAYFVGVLSLVDRVFSMHLEEILSHMKISLEVEDALMRGKGLLGEILALIVRIENFETSSAAAFELKHKLKKGAINETILHCCESVESFMNPAHSPQE